MDISIITPAFNLSRYIADTYASIKNQTYVNWEWIIVDDESTDDTRERIRDFADNRVRLIESRHCGNLSILRNIGAREAKGEILYFVDGDDLLTPDKVETQVELFKRQSDLGWSHTNALTLIDETNILLPRGMRIPPDKHILTPDEAFESLTLGNYIYISSVAVRKEAFMAVGGFEEQFNRCEDIDLWLRLAASGYALGYISEPKLHYRVRKSGLYSSKQIEYLKANFAVFDRIGKMFPTLTARYHSRIKIHYANVFFKLGIATLVGEQSNAIIFFKKSLRYKRSLKRLCWLMMVFFFPAFSKKYILKKQSL